MTEITFDRVNTVPHPKLELRLLHPKYWCVWLGFGLLALLVNVLPYGALRRIGFLIGDLARRLLKRRVHVARTNLSLCFPSYSDEIIEQWVKQNFQNAGMALMETGFAWFWPSWRIHAHTDSFGKEELLQQQQRQRGVLIICGHFFHLEMTARIFSTFAPGYGVYRPHSNPAYEFIQHWGRTRNGNQLVDRKDIKSMIKVLKSGERLWYLPDHDYGPNGSVFAPFFGIQASTVAGPGVLMKLTGCAVVSAVSMRQEDTYILEVDPDFSQQIPPNPIGAATVINRRLEAMIMKGVTQWMWLHKRFKTTPPGIECRY
ncbi:LpxL/LpxP family Kdo(2)-lipid IV(A) lauroyl/palmitoleoyl acyltransferase [Ferrimonas kyonanensis]|uniref:LpxL/LpxP family Kdo(2)-lipid IV(A) lauroyl/palmitoleoyl acyltransferase n=1 Tax=Ferrimonas kyonanensis TaxID=364763 RepID=UPI0004800F63|nr:LpxL/LpxP family Kdo(2)-lipid IV(A) lauroyl/palmitoleoyl acyltransferase [Ferrimonas kyonanensis]